MRRCLKPWVGALVTAVMAAACGVGGASGDGPTVRIGANLWVGYDLLTVAEELDLYGGVDVEIVDFASFSDVVAAFERGHLDGMASTLNELPQVRARTDLDPVAVMVTDISNGADVVLADASIRSVEELTGARVAVEPPLGLYVLSRALSSVGLSLDDVTVVWAQQPEMPILAEAGQIDAAVSFPPWSVRLVSDHGFAALFTSADIPGEVVDVVSFRSQFIEDRPEAVRAVLLAWDRALAHLAEHPDEAIARMAVHEGLSELELRAALEGVELPTLAQQRDLFTDEILDATCRRVAEILVGIDVIEDTLSAVGCVSAEPILGALGDR